jgi:hypothetical protein
MSNFDIDQGSRAKKSGVSRYTQIKLDSLTRERPDLLEEVSTGRKSAHRAAVEAGITKELSPFEKIARLIERHHRDLTPEERHKLKEMLLARPERSESGLFCLWARRRSKRQVVDLILACRISDLRHAWRCNACAIVDGRSSRRANPAKLVADVDDLSKQLPGRRRKYSRQERHIRAECDVPFLFLRAKVDDGIAAAGVRDYRLGPVAGPLHALLGRFLLLSFLAHFQLHTKSKDCAYAASCAVVAQQQF